MARRGDGGGRGRLSPKVIGAGIALVLALVFVLQNTSKTTVEFLWMSFDVGTWFLLVVMFALGWLAGWLLPKFGND